MPLEQLLALYGYRGDEPAKEGGGERDQQTPPLSPARNSAPSECSPSPSPPQEQICSDPPGGYAYNHPPGDRSLDMPLAERPKPLQNPSTDTNILHPFSPARTEGLGLPVDGVGPHQSAELSVLPSLRNSDAIRHATCAQPEPISQEKLSDPACGTGDEVSQVLLEDTPTKGTHPGDELGGGPGPHKRGRPPRGEEGKYRLRPEVPERRSTRLMQNEAAAVEAYFGECVRLCVRGCCLCFVFINSTLYILYMYMCVRCVCEMCV